jgi:penicillin V acylase-like amidase (Ntn superfamily)
MRVRIVVLLVVAVLTFADATEACTAFLATHGDMVLAGNNEDFFNPRTKVWFIPAAEGKFGRVYFGFDNFVPQGGMNERGLFWDGFATAPRKVTGGADKPKYPGNLNDKVMAECATVEEVLAVFDKYNRDNMEGHQLLFGDAKGDSVIIEGDAVVRKKGRFQVVTNFRQSSTPVGQETCERYKTAVSMLENSDEVSVPLFRRVLMAVHQEADSPTLYSNIYDLKQRVVYLYHFHNFENVVVLDLAEELKKGKRELDLPSLFPVTVAAESFARNKLRQLEEQRNVKRATDVDPAVYDAYAGQYRLSAGPIPGLIVTILRQGNGLYLEAPGVMRFELIPESATTFFYASVDSFVKMTFTRNDPGKATGFDGQVNDSKLSGKRVE